MRPFPRQLPAWAPSAAVAAALAALIALSFHERWEILGGTPFPVGVDGYFYPIQLRALLETGGLQYPAAPLSFWLMAPLAALTDPLTGAKLGAALYGALIALPAYALGARLGRGRGAGLVAAVLATRSAGSAYLTFEFVKNGIGLTVALAALWLILRATDAPTRARLAAAGLALAAAALTHKMAAGLVAVVAVPAVLAAAAAHGALRGRRLRLALGGLVGLAALAALAGLAFPQRFLSPADTALVEGLFTADARWDAPAHLGARSVLSLGHEALAGLVLGLLAGLAGLRLGARAIRAATHAVIPREYVATPAPRPGAPGASGASGASGAPGDAAAGWAVIGLAIAIGLPWLAVSDAQGLGFRLRVAAFVPMALAAALLAGRLLAHLRYRDLVLAALAVALLFYTPGSRDEGVIRTHPALVTSVHAMTGRVPPGDTVIVPERHIAYMIAWYTRARISLRPEPIPAERRWRVMPLAWIEASSPLDRALLAARARPGLAPPLGLHPGHPNGLVLVAEPTWQAIAARLPAPSRWRTWTTR